MSFFALKVVAVLAMFYDHFSTLFPYGPLGMLSDALIARFPEQAGPINFLCSTLLEYFLLPYIGRLAAPIFMFCIANGYRHTHDVKRYAIRIFVFAAAAQIPYALFFRAESLSYGLPPDPFWQTNLNFMFTLGFGLLSIWAFDSFRKKGLLAAAGGAAVFLLAAELLHTESGGSYAALVLAFHLTMDLSKPKRALIFLLLFPLARWRNVVWLMTEPSLRVALLVILNVLGPWLGVLFTLLYNGKKSRAGKAAQYFVYAFYPAHFLILALPLLLG